jgi:hypothetical protein
MLLQLAKKRDETVGSGTLVAPWCRAVDGQQRWRGRARERRPTPGTCALGVDLGSGLVLVLGQNGGVGKDGIGSAVVRGMMVGFGQVRNEMCGSVRPFVALTVLKYRTVEKAL